MKKIAVVVDSTAVIGNETIKNNSNLYSIPLQVIFGNESYKDGIDLTPSEFFNKFDESDVLPTTSQPSIGELIELFEDIVDIYDHIIYITISSKISGTFQAGVLAQSQVSEDKITVIDSKFTSILQKEMALESLELINNGASLEEVLENIEYIKNKGNVLLVVDDLKHLARMGRLKASEASIGSLLKVKPVLHFVDGEILVKTKIRTTKKSHKKLVDLVSDEKLNDDSKILIAHASGMGYALSLKEEVQKVYPNIEIRIDELSPVISVNTGPKTVGIAWINKNN